MYPISDLIPEREVHALDLLRARHGNSLDDTSTRDFFNRLHWFEILRTHCFADTPLLIAQAEEGDARAILVLAQCEGRLVALANWYSFSFAPMFINADTPDVRERLLTRIARDLRRAHGCVSLYPVLNDAGMASLIVRSFRAAGWIAHARDAAHNHLLRITDRDFDAYWAARPGQLRKKVRKKGKSPDLSYHVHDSVTDELWRDYLVTYAASWKKREPHPLLMRALADDAAARGALRLAFLRQDGRAIATQLWTIEGDVALVHKIAHDQHCDALSPGTLLAHHMFRRAFEQETVGIIDYGTGDNAYKREWMDEERAMMLVDCFDPARPSQWCAAARCTISALVGRKNGR